MQKHLFIAYFHYRIVGGCLVFLVWLLCASLLVLYGNMDGRLACGDSLVMVALLAVSGFLLGYMVAVLRSLLAKVALTLLVQVVCVAGSFIFQAVFSEKPGMPFVASIPLRLLLGVSCWIILWQWYYYSGVKEEEADECEQIQEEVEEARALAGSVALPAEEPYPDRLSVKDGSRIHLIPLGELLYIQASGDYVTLITADGQYVKEQTMKYLELHLPPASFVRIHRSCIVNAEQIVRVELFAKETYQVRLKNGVCLKASKSGYKVLRERLGL